MIDFWFTSGSTYTYLTVMRLPEIERTHGVRFNWRPFDRRTVSNVEGPPFTEGSSKTAYMWRDIERRAAKYSISARVPAPYPPKDSTLRNCVALLGLREGWGKAFVRANYVLCFQHGQEMDGVNDIAASLRQIDQDPQRVLDLARSGEIRRQYDDNTSRARDLGIFGSPTFAVGGEIFWGDDHLEDALSWHRHGRLS
jgi:2-hydroxychromene-2-carboxylate isomerase